MKREKNDKLNRSYGSRIALIGRRAVSEEEVNQMMKQAGKNIYNFQNVMS